MMLRRFITLAAAVAILMHCGKQATNGCKSTDATAAADCVAAPATPTPTPNTPRAADATLSALSLSTGSLTPAFAAATTSYAVTVPNATASLKVTPTTTVATSTIKVKINSGSAATVASGSASGSLALAVGANTITIVVTSGDSSKTATYTVTVTRTGPSDATLSALEVSSGTLSPSFSAATTSYSLNTTGRSLTVTLTVSTAGATVQVQLASGTAATVASGTASSALTLVAGTNTITVKVTAGDGVTTKIYTITAIPPLVFATGQAASRLIGQSSYGSTASGSTAATLSGPTGLSVSDSGLFLISDTGNNRVMAYASVPTSDGASASFVVGQQTMTGAASGNGPTDLNGPTSARTDGQKLYVSDTANNRVLIYNAIPSASYAAADVAIGAGSTTGVGNAACSQTGLTPKEAYPYTSGGVSGLAVLGSKRALIYHSVPASSGASADLVLGQGNFTTCAVGIVNGASALWTNGTLLAVADTTNNNVLIWKTFPTATNQAPDITLTADNATGGLSLVLPKGIVGNATQLFVADSGNNRVLIWNLADLASSGAAAVATTVLGQSSFSTTATGSTASTLNNPTGLSYDSTGLYVADTANNRVLGFKSQ